MYDKGEKIEVKIVKAWWWGKETKFTGEKSYNFYDENGDNYRYYTKADTTLDDYSLEEINRGNFKISARIKEIKDFAHSSYVDYILEYPSIKEGEI